MNLQDTQKKLQKARKRARMLREEIAMLRVAIIDAGGNPNPPRFDYLKRNKEIYKAWKDGKSFSEIGREFQISYSRVNDICRKIDWVLELKGSGYKRYEDLLVYRN